MFLKTDTVYLRAPESSDLSFLYELENDVSIWPVSYTITPLSKAVLKQYLDNAALDIYTTKQLRLIICTTNQVQAGVADLFDFDPLHQRAGLGIVIAQAYRRQYLASQALALLLEYCRHYLLLHQVYCSIATDNEASLKLFKAAGFSIIGERKDWVKTTAGWKNILELQKILS